MAKIRTIAPVGQIRGSIGGATYSQNRYGSYIRARSLPTVVHTEFTESIRNAFTTATKLWRNLTPEQKSAWAVYAENNKVYDNFGEQQVITGHAMFVKVNTLLQAYTHGTNLMPPGKAAPGAVPNYTVDVLNNETDKVSSVSIKFNTPFFPDDTEMVLDVRIAVVDSFGRRIQENMWKFLSVGRPEFTPTTMLLNSALKDRGLAHIEGYVPWLRLRLYNWKEGTWGPWDACEAPNKVKYEIVYPVD